MDSTIVIKVKYEKTLRRFNARVSEAGKMELSLNELREKILSLFKLSPEVDLMLTYLDEDGDSVTLADNEDLRDVMMQSLDPLRITAKVNKENDSTSSASSCWDFTPKSSASISRPLPNGNNTLSDLITKLSLDFASKATASSPQLPKHVENFSKLLQNIITASESPIEMKKLCNKLAALERTKSLSITKETEVLGGHAAKPNVVAGSKSVDQPFKSEKKVDPRFCTLEKNANVINVSALNPKKPMKKICGSKMKAEACKPAWENIKAVASSVLGANDKEVTNPGNASSFFPKDISSKNAKAGGFHQNVAGQCPFSGTLVSNESSVPYTHFGPRVHPFKRSYSQGGVAGISHSGVQCDGCGVHPITGPRFKSKVKHDYDLCSICFAEMGSESDYIRLDRPISSMRCHHSKRVYDFSPQVKSSPTMPQVHTGVVKPEPQKVDSRFVKDVNVIDGTLIAPSTPFTKIWQMRNSGNVIWPHGTQLVWIGGEYLGAPLSTTLQIPVEGLAVENELEVAVDFVAPKLPGRYISYWRMATPSGEKFGQRIWVLIQVDASAKDSAVAWTKLKINSQGLNLNLPPESNGFDKADNRTINVEPIVVDGRYSFPEPSNKATDMVDPLVAPPPTKNQDLDFPKNYNFLINTMPTVDSHPLPNTIAAFLTPPSMPLVSEPPMPFVSKPPMPLVLEPPMPLVSEPPMPLVSESLGQENCDKDDVEEILLKELEEMGFKQVDLNKKILRVNEYNLEQSVDDLCDVSEWDPILEELQEMGFNDNEVNKKLLKINNGSIKGVVMDLITGKKV